MGIMVEYGVFVAVEFSVDALLMQKIVKQSGH